MLPLTWLRLALPVVFLGLLAHTAWVKSPTWDEPGYLGLGPYLLDHGRWDVPGAGSHPPLAYYLQGLPFLRPAYSLVEDFWSYPDHTRPDLSFVRSADVDRGNAILMDPRYDGEMLLWLCRMTSVFSAAALLLCLWRWASDLYGVVGATVALGTACLSPNLLAHASLATTDFVLAATYFSAFYGLRCFLLRPDIRRLLLAGALGGLALASKLSALVWLPTTAVLLGWTVWLAPFETRSIFERWGGLGIRPWLGAALAGAGLVLTAATVVWTAYGFRVIPYWTVISSQLWDLSFGHEAYLLGQYSSQGWWYYFPIAFLVKTPVPSLILGLWGIIALLRDRARLWDHGMLLLPPAVFFLAFVLSQGKAIGLRYLLPVYPFLFVVTGASIRCSWSSAHRWRRHALLGLGAALLLTTARIHPDHLAYFNEAAGGPDGGHRVLVDSNLDWGQDLKGLKAWMDEQGVPRIKLSYFGSVDPALYHLNYEWLPSYLLPDEGIKSIELPTTGWIAVSVTNRVGVYMDMYGHGKGLYDWLNPYQPVARIGHTIWVYRIPPATP
ncbi:MAG: glycosyltransferase family 39 protein [bacterium]|nr:glycosyltransferase family 39 protein [bacterium]